MSVAPAILMREFVVRLAGRESTEVLSVIGGVGTLNLTYPHSHQHNQLLLSEQVPVETAAAEADRVLGGHGLGHRRVSWLAQAPVHWNESLEALGWTGEPGVLMSWGRRAAPAPAVEVRRVDAATVRPAAEASWIEEGQSPEVAHQLAGRTAATEQACALTNHVVIDKNGDVLAWAELRVLTVNGVKIGQIEGVYTKAAQRRRGFGRAVTLDAVRCAQEQDCGLIFLEALELDFPRHLYADLGFRPRASTLTAWRAPIDEA
jgi:GNAT superfamily N-acetyltransferase